MKSFRLLIFAIKIDKAEKKVVYYINSTMEEFFCFEKR